MAKAKDETPGSDLAVQGTGTDVALAGPSIFDAGGDTETYSLKDVALPYIAVLQALSPQVNKRDGAYVEGAEPGMLFNSATGQVWDGEKGVDVIICAKHRRFGEWWPRDSKAGKGLVHDFGQDEDAALARVLELGKYPMTTAEGTVIIEQGTYYAMLLEDEEAAPVKGVIALSGTQFKKYKGLNSFMSSWQVRLSDGRYVNPPIFTRTYKLTTVPEQNDQGNWMGVKFSQGKPLDVTGDSKLDAKGIYPNGRQLYEMAKSFRAQIMGGQVHAAPPIEPAAGGEVDDIPF